MGTKGGGRYLVVLNVLFSKIESGAPVSHHESTRVSFSRKITIGKESTYLSDKEKHIKL